MTEPSGKTPPEDILLPLFRAILTSSVAAVEPTEEVKSALSAAHSATHSAVSASSAARSTVSAAISAVSAAHSAAHSADSAALSAAHSAAISAALSTSSAAHSAAISAVSADSATLSAAPSESDLTSGGGEAVPRAVFNSPLWWTEPTPSQIAANWDNLRDALRAHPAPWDFWIDWYERHLNGRPQNWDLLEQIVLLPDEDWQKGAAHINLIIESLALRTASDALPYAEELKVRDETNLVYALPIPIEDQPTYDRALDRLADILEMDKRQNFLGGSFTADVLNKAVTEYRDDPQRVHEDVVESRSIIEGEIKKEYLPDNSFGNALLERLDQTALDIRRTHPKVAETAMKRALQRLRETSALERKDLLNELHRLREVAEQQLADEIAQDIELFIAELEGVMAGQEKVPSAAGYRLASRALRIADFIAKGVVGFASGVTAIDALATLIRSIFGL
ncbi:MAG: hypothetical protein AAGF22_05605 [Pseudomonadota bacterium]